MAPKRGESIEHNDEHEKFMKTLAEYHEKRGTLLDVEPKIGNRHVDLLKLYTRVVDEGGYDLCSDTKAKPLMWRKLAEEFIGKNQYTAAQAFQIKNVYYKNLCAYEISTHWGKEPPPKEILEDVTAKGGNVMGRTVENYQRSTPRESENLNGDGSPEQETPKQDAVDSTEDPGSAAGRTSRGLRQQPPQRVLFQPDVHAGRNTRGGAIPQAGLAHSTGTPPGVANGMLSSSLFANGASSTLASYEPSQAYPLSLKPVMTPANKPEFYVNERKRKAEANAGPLAKKYKHIMLPGTGFIGPNIYIRAQLALQSGIPQEESYGLHHLVKISYERGDKYRFDQFPGLAEALLNKGLQVTSLFYDVEWDIDFDDSADQDGDEMLNGLQGTSNVIDKLLSRMPLVTNDGLQDENFVAEIGRITEAGLVVRNMCLQAENAQYVATLPLARDFMAIVLNLPRHPSIVELKYHVLDIAEQVLLWCDVGPRDALYQSLLAQLESEDRGLIVSALKIIPRIAMKLAPSKRLENVDAKTLRRIQDWLLLEDEELRSACLDFLFQFTAFADNVDKLLQSIDADILTRQLSRLLLFAAKEQKEPGATVPAEDEMAPSAVPRLSKSLVEHLLKLDEPERSSEWLRMCFVHDAGAEMTQISLWQAYQGAFGPFAKTHPHLIAGDFIKNVSTTFPGAAAQVAAANKYVIKGIKARKVPIDTGMLSGSRATDKGRELDRCRWKMTVPGEPTRHPLSGEVVLGPSREVECSEWFKHGSDMLRHILHDHLSLPLKPSPGHETEKMDIDRPSPTGSALANNSGTETSSLTLRETFDFQQADQKTYRCRWTVCHRTSHDFDSDKASRTALFARHVQTHIPDTETPRSKYNVKPSARMPLISKDKISLMTMTDERGETTGLAMSAALVLRNIAKFLPKKGSQSQADELKAAMDGEKQSPTGDDDELIAQIFDDEIRERLFFATAYSKTMQHPASNVLRAISKHST